MVVFRSFLEMRRRSEDPCSNVTTCQCRDVWSTEVKVKERHNVPTLNATLRRFHNFYIRIITSTGDPIFEIIDRRTDEEPKTKQEQPERSKRLVFLYFSSQKPLMIYRTMLVLIFDTF